MATPFITLIRIIWSWTASICFIPESTKDIIKEVRNMVLVSINKQTV